jgi:hypothetical protein
VRLGVRIWLLGGVPGDIAPGDCPKRGTTIVSGARES